MRGLVVALAFFLAAPEARAEKPSPPQAPRPVAPEEIERLRREIAQEERSSLDLIFDGHTESGDLNNKLESLGFGARLNLKRGSATTVHLTARQMPYRTQDGVVQEYATSLALGVQGRRSDRLEYEWEVGATRFSNDAWNGTGLVAVTVRPSEKLRYSLRASRSFVEESMLSAVGLRPVLGPFAGARVGGVTDNRGAAALTLQLPYRTDVVGEAALGVRAGSNTGTNFFKRAGGGPAWNAVARAPEEKVSLFRVGVWFEYFGFDEDRLGYGGASLVDAQYRPVPLSELGSDGIPPDPAPAQPGVGGYFSPHRFTSTVGRVDLRGRARDGVDYSFTAFVGTQSYTGSDRRGARGLAVKVTLRASPRLSVPIAYSWDDYGPFTQQSLQARLVIHF
jgi:hypothetical protein